MGILNKNNNQLINLFKYFLSKIGQKLETGILSIRSKFIKLLKKIGIFKGKEYSSFPLKLRNKQDYLVIFKEKYPAL